MLNKFIETIEDLPIAFKVIIFLTSAFVVLSLFNRPIESFSFILFALVFEALNNKGAAN